jgi:hypothetical protein
MKNNNFNRFDLFVVVFRKGESRSFYEYQAKDGNKNPSKAERGGVKAAQNKEEEVEEEVKEKVEEKEEKEVEEVEDVEQKGDETANVKKIWIKGHASVPRIQSDWIIPTEGDIDEFFGESGKLWTPARWDTLNTKQPKERKGANK